MTQAPRGEGGAVSIVVATGGLAFCVFALCGADLGSVLLARARAQAAADAAALAAAARLAPVLGQGADARAAAEDAAARNGGTLESCSCDEGDTVADVVVVVRARATVVRAWDGILVRAGARASVDADVYTYRD